ncbi:MAG: copper resistance protein CopC, partial [Dehalococcoidia bacterium]
MRTRPLVRSLAAGTIAIAVALLIATVSILLSPGHAQAHALLVRSDPVVDAKLLDPPLAVSTWFSESLDRSLSTMRVLDAAGEQVDDGAVSFSDDDGTMMSVGIREALQPGFYVVVWETLSSVDGHFIKGSFPFTVLNQDGSEPAGARPEVGGITSGGEPTVDAFIGKTGGLIGAVGLLGSLAFALWV